VSGERAEDRRGRAWLGVAGVAVGHLAVDACVGVWPVFKVLAQLDLRLAGLIAAVASVVGNGAQLVFGPLADRGYRRILIGAGVAAAGAVFLLPYAVPQATPLVLLMVLGAVGSAAVHPAGAGHVATARTGRPGLAMAVYLAGGAVGFGMSQLLYTGLYRGLSGRLAPLTALPLLLGAALLVVGRGPRPAAFAASGAKAPPATAPVPWGKVAALFAIQGLSACIGVAVQFLTPEVFGGRGAMAMGGANAVATLTGALALFPAGAARDRFGAWRVLFAFNLLAGSALGLLAFLGPRDPRIAFVAVPLFTFANSANTVVAVAEGTQGLAGKGSSVAALLMGLPWLVSSPAPALAALLADPGRGGSPEIALGWMALCSPAAAAVALLLPRIAAKDRSPTTSAPPRPSGGPDTAAA
jgi:MFS transporter, FSR family, fosmidomycin resistance protein